jgi:NitT/TauT family transport system substrate-binding protein
MHTKTNTACNNDCRIRRIADWTCEIAREASRPKRFPELSFILSLARKLLPFSGNYSSGRFIGKVNKMHSRKMKWLILLLLSISFIGCWKSSKEDNSTTKVAEELKGITVCQYGDLLIYLPLYIAKEKGFFQQEGLNVRFINGGGDDKTYAAVSSGNAQFGVSDPTFTAIAREKGQPGVVVATIVAGAPFWGVTWDNSIAPISSISQLNNKRIATYESPSTNYALMASTLKQATAATSKAKIVEGAYGTLLAILKSGRADIAMELEPVASTAVRDGARIVFSYPEIYGEFMLTGLYVLESYRDANQKTVQSVVNALERAMQFAHEDLEGAINVGKAWFPDVDPEVIASAVTRMVKESTLPEHVTMSPVGWANAIKVRVELGDLKSSLSADATLDHVFATKAVEQSSPVGSK